MIIDAHAHIYPDKIAVKAAKSIENFYDLHVANDGSVGALLRLGKEASVDKFIVHSVATVPEQVTAINNFIIDSVNAHPDTFIGFCTLHPDSVNPETEIDRIIDAGLKGIKLHPDFQKFNLDDEKLFKIYEAAEGRIPILFHMGDTRYEYSKAKRLYKVINKFEKLTVIGAHFAGYSEWEESVKILAGTGIYVDTSSSLEWLSPEKAYSLIKSYGVDRVLFASDYPMWSPADELKKLARIPLSKEERELILHTNAERLLNTL